MQAFILFCSVVLLSLTLVTLGESQLAAVSKSFERVWDGHHRRDINSVRLLEACHCFLGVLRKTAPKAVERDFRDNMKKAETLMKKGGDDKRLSSLLVFERDCLAIHSRKKLVDNSGAMGFLWIRRSLEFQSDLLSSITDGAEPREAALKAYRSKLRPYHGMFLRRFYTACLSTKMPTRPVMLVKISGRASKNSSAPFLKNSSASCEEAVIEDLKRLTKAWQPLLCKWKQTFTELDLEDDRRV
jgi:hypothetical protein